MYSTQNCDDSNVCTTDSCSGSGCSNIANTGSCGTRTVNCPGGSIAVCSKTCSLGSCVDCTPECPDPCAGVVCNRLSETCSDGSVKSCTPSCSNGNCGSCTINCPNEPPKEIAEKLAPEEEKGIVACVNITKKTGSGQLSVTKSTVDQSLIPDGYSVVVEPFKTDCNQDSLSFTIAIPENYEDVKVLKCGNNGCGSTTVDYVTELWCGDKIQGEIKREKKTINPDVMPIEIEETSVNISDIKEQIASGSTSVKFLGKEFEGVVTIKKPSTAIVEAQNPYLQIVSTPLVLEFSENIKEGISTEVTIPYVLSNSVDETSLAVYAQNKQKWEYIDSSIDYENKLVSTTVNNISMYLDSDNKATFAVMGILTGFENATLNLVYLPDKNTKDMMIFIHGVGSSPETYQKMIDDIRLTQQPVAIYTFGYSFSDSLNSIADTFREDIENVSADYDNIYFVSHSAGGLVTQQALYSASLENMSFVKKVDNVILIATPNEGSPIAEVYKNLFKGLVNEKTDYPLFNINSALMQDLVKGKIIPRLDHIAYYVVAGTKPYDLKLPAFKKDSLLLDDSVWDGVVTTKSASHVGDGYLKDKCQNYWELYLTHNELVYDQLSRKVVENIISKDILHVGNILGKSKYFNLDIPDCDNGESYVVIGKKTDEIKPVATFCSCGNDKCDEGENKENCPEDCRLFLAMPKNNKLLNGFAYIVIGSLAILLVFKFSYYPRLIWYAKTAANKNDVLSQIKSVLNEINRKINSKEMASADKSLKDLNKNLAIFSFIAQHNEYRELRHNARSIKKELKKIESENINLYRDQLEIENKTKVVDKFEPDSQTSKIKNYTELPKKPGFAKVHIKKTWTIPVNEWLAQKIYGFAVRRSAKKKNFTKEPVFVKPKLVEKTKEEIIIDEFSNRILSLKNSVDHLKSEIKHGINVGIGKQVELFKEYSKIYASFVESSLKNKKLGSMENKLKNVHKDLVFIKAKNLDSMKVKPTDKKEEMIFEDIKPISKSIFNKKWHSLSVFGKIKDSLSKIRLNIKKQSDSRKVAEKIKISQSIFDKLKSKYTERDLKDLSKQEIKIKKYDVSEKKQKDDLDRRYQKLLEKTKQGLDIHDQVELFKEYVKLYEDIVESCLSESEKDDLIKNIKVLYKKIRKN
jgi:pimeloyl-ACP methyl ester carboxylesterase